MESQGFDSVVVASQHPCNTSELDQLARAIPAGVALLDADLNYLLMNEQFARMENIRAEGSIGVHITEATPRLFTQLDSSLREVFATGDPVTHVQIAVHQNLNLHPRLARDRSVQGVFLIATKDVCNDAEDNLERKQLEIELERRLAENTELKRRLESENLYQREEFKTVSELSEIVGQSGAMQKVYRQIAQVGPAQSPVLITGETGTGKELVARAIHAASPRKDRIMVPVNCATLPGSLIESELFGREKGAYTGALTRQVGRFELANGGTLLLDEIGELSVELQGKLLRVLQEGAFERLGNPKTIKVDVRLIAATNRNLIEAVNAGIFRKDLYYRLSVFPIELPPLRERTDDIPILAWAFIEEFNQKMGKRIVAIPAKTMELLKSYSWPGNVRELRNTIEHAMIVSVGDKLELQLPEARQSLESSNMTLEEVMHRSIAQALKKTDWRIKGPRGAAAILGLRPSTLYTKMKKLGIPLRAEKTL